MCVQSFDIDRRSVGVEDLHLSEGLGHSHHIKQL